MKQKNADKKLDKRVAGYEAAQRDKGKGAATEGSVLHEMHKPGSRKRD